MEKARTRSRASAGGRSRTEAASSRAAWLVPVAAADRGVAVELHQLEELLPALLAQDLPDQRAERMHVLAQGLVLRRKMDVAAAHGAADGSQAEAPGYPASRTDSARSSSSGCP